MCEHDEVGNKVAEQAPTVRDAPAAAPESDEAMRGEPICAADGTALVSASGEPMGAPSEGSAAQDAAGAVYAHGKFL